MATGHQSSAAAFGPDFWRAIHTPSVQLRFDPQQGASDIVREGFASGPPSTMPGTVRNSLWKMTLRDPNDPHRHDIEIRGRKQFPRSPTLDTPSSALRDLEGSTIFIVGDPSGTSPGAVINEPLPTPILLLKVSCPSKSRYLPSNVRAKTFVSK